MIITALIMIAITLISLIMTIIGTALPNMNMAELRAGVDQFIQIQEMGLTGFKFMVGDVGIKLAGYALGIYIAYYSILIIYEIVTKIFLKGQ